MHPTGLRMGQGSVDVNKLLPNWEFWMLIDNDFVLAAVHNKIRNRR